MELSELHGIGSKTLEILHSNNIYTINNLIEFYPKAYDIIESQDYNEASFYEDKTCFFGQIVSKVSYIKNSTLFFYLISGNKRIKVYTFNRPYLRFGLVEGKFISVYGRYKKDKNMFSLEKVFNGKAPFQITPLYKCKISDKKMSQFIEEALPYYKYKIDIPNTILDKYKLVDKPTFFKCIHTPYSRLHIKHAYRRLKYEEMLNFSLSFLIIDNLESNKKGIIIDYDNKVIDSKTTSLPYKLTKDQLTTINDVLSDLKSTKATNRVIQGDVGCGKTVVALMAILASISTNHQSVVMVPSVSLAYQHYEYFSKMLDQDGYSVEVLTSRLRKKESDELKERIKSGEVDLLISTSSVLSSEVEFRSLGLIVIDEQHRFGVLQRSKLVSKEEGVNKLFLSATPIPRTFGLTNFCGLDLSSIHTLPAGKKPIKTIVLENKDFSKLKDMINATINRGEQIYLIAPLISDTENSKLPSLDRMYDYFVSEYGESNVCALHSKLSEEVKEEVLEDFRLNKFPILISTTVIEVGIDIKNATLIAIFGSERFGISQLHQLRGRVGRNTLDNTCVLMTSDKDNMRLKLVSSSTDGFFLAEQDFYMRGPGNYFGVMQSGNFNLLYSDFAEDKNIYTYAFSDAKSMMKSREETVKEYIKKITNDIEENINLN